MKTAELLAAQSGASSFTTVAYDLGDLDTFAIYVLFPGGGTLAGTLTVEASPDQTDANFVEVSGSSQAVTASTQHTWSLLGQGYRYVRVRWAYSSGAGNVQIKIQVKENVVKGA